jgi:hypothetical protein
MKKLFLTCMLTAAATAQSLAAESESMSLSIKALATRQCVAEQECTGFVKGSISFNGVINLTPEEEAALQEETSVTLDLDEVEFDIRLGDDPNFATGDTSAKISTNVTIFSDIIAKANVQLKWGNGQLKIKASLHFAGDDVISKKPLLTASKDTKEPNGLEVSISAINGLTPVFAIEQLVTGDSKESFFRLESANGDVSNKESFAFKSRVVPVI